MYNLFSGSNFFFNYLFVIGRYVPTNGLLNMNKAFYNAIFDTSIFTFRIYLKVIKVTCHINLNCISVKIDTSLRRNEFSFQICLSRKRGLCLLGNNFRSNKSFCTLQYQSNEFDFKGN